MKEGSLPEKVKALFVDMDGTLVNTLPMLFDVYEGFLKERGIKGSKEEFSELNGPSLKEVIHILKQRYSLEERSEQLLQQYHDVLTHKYSQGVPLFPDAKETLTHLKNRGLALALVTSAAKALADSFIKGQNLVEIFDFIVTPEGLMKGKPFPDIYLRALKAVGVAPKEIIAIEDSLNGVEAACGAGIFTLWITHHQKFPLKKTPPLSCLPVCDWKAIDHLLKE